MATYDQTASVISPNPIMDVLRQAGLLIGIAASVALGAYVMLWARSPNYTLLYSDLGDRDITQIAEALDSSDIPYRVDPASGGVLVAASQIHDAKLQLATAGLPRGAGIGFELMQDDGGFGTSQFLERARYQRAIEGELSRSIAKIKNVRTARVHLGMPAETAFARSKREPSASVIVELYAGRRLEAEQVGAISHLVSASVPNLPADKVTIVDQNGNLLTAEDSNDEIALSGKRFDYNRRIEASYVQRVEAILMPYVGPDGVRAEVSADIDFTSSEQTRETFNPDLPAVRSERLLEEERVGKGVAGVPGALTNEPPIASESPEVAESGGEQTEEVSTQAPGTSRKQTTRNYELDRTISHTKPSTGVLRRLSVAVVIRDKQAVVEASAEATAEESNQGTEEAAAASPAAGFSDKEIAEMTQLVKDAIGFNVSRGDTVSLRAVEFLVPPEADPLPEPPIWQQPWVWNIGKQVLGGIFALIVLFTVIRPAVKTLMKKPEPPMQLVANPDGTPRSLESDANAQAETTQAANEGGGEAKLLAPPGSDADVEQIQKFVQDQPKVSAQIVKGWVAAE
ncbi:MAG: flagellar basal-body MS-ring/collar protein FliF [Pseudomonadota bacterium]